MQFAELFMVFAETPDIARFALGAAVGLAVGSYLATVVVRWPRGESANAGRSGCDGCGRHLAWHELIPLISFLRARGRCRTCGRRINPLHLLVEVISGLLGGYLLAFAVPTLAPFAWLLLLLAVFDARLFWLPDRLVLPLAIIGIVTPSWQVDAALGDRLVSGTIGFAALWMVGAGFRKATGSEGLGGGDPKLFGAIALWLGARDLPLLMLIACAIGLLDAAWRWSNGTQMRGLRLPLGTYLCLAALGFVVAQPLRQTVQKGDVISARGGRTASSLSPFMVVPKMPQRSESTVRSPQDIS